MPAICRLFILLIIFLGLTLPASARQAITWPELGPHLKAAGKLEENLPVTDCPAGLAAESADHTVCQIIENTFYKWKEYRFFDQSGKSRLAIEMISPEKKRLSAEQAGILLSGSKLCRLSNPEKLPEATSRAVPLEPEPALDFKPSENDATALREIVQGSDDRTRVTDDNDITSYPWNTICYLRVDFNGDIYRGTGILISPSLVLTCGHIVWDSNLGGWATEVGVTAAQHQNCQGGEIFEPYGTIYSNSVSSNTLYLESEAFSYDYGVVKLSHAFSSINTFMPLEYGSTPDVIHLAGYPGTVQYESLSYDLWYDYDMVTGYEGVDNRVLLHQADTSSGQSGAPVWRYDELTDNYRLVAIHVMGAYRNNGACRLVSSMEPIISEWQEYQPEAYSYESYIPYFITNSSRWTGLALANHNVKACNLMVEYFSPSGESLGRQNKTIPAYGQESFAISAASGSEGWIRISSSTRLSGLALIGDNSWETMYDIDLKSDLSKKYLCCHLAADEDWRSHLMVCNPNDQQIGISYTYYNPEGELVANIPNVIAAHGSVHDSVYTYFRRNLSGGTMIIEASQPVAVFMLYENRSTTWKAGLSAVPVN